MLPLYRIPVAVPAAGIAVVEDLDLAFLLRHSGADAAPDLARLTARTADGKAVPAQWLDLPEPSIVPRQRRGTLLLGATRGPGRIDLFVRAGPAPAPQDKQKDAEGVRIRETPDALEIRSDGQLFVTYRFNTKDPQVPRPYFHPLAGPAGQTITQMGEVPDKRVKHFHHTALWVAHQNFAARGQPACDNWQIGRPNSSRIEHVRFDSVQGGPMAGRFAERLRWLNVKGDRTLLEETRTVTVPRLPAARRAIDLDIRLRATDLPVTFNRTPYHLLAVRVLDALLPGKGGVITNSAGTQNPADGVAANWIDISGRLGEASLGVALFNHPDNFRHPTPCLQFARQTIGLSPTHREAYTLEAGRELRLRYRVLVHAGNVKDGGVAGQYEAYARPGQTRIGAPERVSV
jgi:hypothetical protein